MKGNKVSMKRNLIAIFFILLLNLIMLSGCYDSRGIEELAYVTAIGLDVSENNLLNLTLQISIPSSGSSSESGSSQSSKTNSITVECTSINSGLALANSYISKELDLSHCKVIIFSEKLAEQGISSYVDTLANNVEIRPDCNIIITKSNAKNFIEDAKPSIEALTARYYEVSINSSKYTGYTPSTELIDFIGSLKNSTIQASAILGGLNNNTNNSSQSHIITNSDNNYVAGKTPTETKDSVEGFGTAVFYNDKLIGELTGMETICHLMVMNKFESCTISVPDLFNTNHSNIDLRLFIKKNPNIKVEIVNGSPFIHVEVYLQGYGLSLDSNTDYSSQEELNKINKSAENYIENKIKDYLYKTAKEFNSDIDGCGKIAIYKYLTINDWHNSNWLDNYQNSFFDVKAHVNIKSGYEFNKSP